MGRDDTGGCMQRSQMQMQACSSCHSPNYSKLHFLHLNWANCICLTFPCICIPRAAVFVFHFHLNGGNCNCVPFPSRAGTQCCRVSFCCNMPHMPISQKRQIQVQIQSPLKVRICREMHFPFPKFLSAINPSVSH